jgi:hypothetical protein
VKARWQAQWRELGVVSALIKISRAINFRRCPATVTWLIGRVTNRPTATAGATRPRLVVAVSSRPLDGREDGYPGDERRAPGWNPCPGTDTARVGQWHAEEPISGP